MAVSMTGKKWRTLAEVCYYCQAPIGESCWNTSANRMNGTVDDPVFHYYEPKPHPGPHLHPKRAPAPPPTFEEVWLTKIGRPWGECRDADEACMARIAAPLRAELMALWSADVKKKVAALPSQRSQPSTSFKPNARLAPTRPSVTIYCPTDED